MFAEQPIEEPAAKDTIEELTPWKEHGLCRGLMNKAEDIFFPKRGASSRQAKKLCERCPVKAECLDYAIKYKIKFGVWGGMSARERALRLDQYRRRNAS